MDSREQKSNPSNAHAKDSANAVQQRPELSASKNINALLQRQYFWSLKGCNNSRSGLKTVPNNAKVHYNYANVLKEEGRLTEAASHYKEALR